MNKINDSMEKEKIKSMLRSASDEIKRLQYANQFMDARLSMFDDMMMIFRSRPDIGSTGRGEDITYMIDKFLVVLGED